MTRRIVFAFVVIAVIAGAEWGVFHFRGARRHVAQSQNNSAYVANGLDPDAWNRAVEKVKENRVETGGGLEIPPELRHYEERYWFLATQVAEIEKYNVHTCQDYLDLAVTIERGEMVPVPGVTETYVLL